MKLYKITALAIALIFSAGQAFACSCAPERSAADQAERYPLIFLGTAMASVDVTPPPPPIKRSFWERLQFWKPAPEPDLPNIQSLETGFQVTRILKGDQTELVTVSHLSSQSGSLCGVSFREGDEYLILAYERPDGTFGTNLCSSPQFPLEDFDAALAPSSTPVPASGDLTALFGTWGADEAQCRLPQEVRGAPFILTQSSFDQHETHCDVSFTPADARSWTMEMSCSVEGDQQEFEEWITVFDGTLLRRMGGDSTAQGFIRCSPSAD